MRTITTTDELAAFCEAAKSAPYVTIDTEFLRERTYWSKLCLIQMALPGKDGDAVLVDPILGEEVEAVASGVIAETGQGGPGVSGAAIVALADRRSTRHRQGENPAQLSRVPSV